MGNDRSGRRTPRLFRTAARLAWLAGALLAPAAPVRAQLGLSAALLSEYSVRGMSLSSGRPEPQLRLDYDAEGGWYAGAQASGIALADSSADVQLIAYGGYARRLESGLSWDAGALQTQFGGGAEYRYHEFYAGLAREDVSARLYYSPAYYGEGKTVYAEYDHAWPLGSRLRFSAHVGLLQAFGHGGDEARRRIDLRAALGGDAGPFRLQLAVLASAPDGGRDAPRRLEFRARYGF